MFIVMIAPECAPAAKVGGLGDVVHGLSKELSIRGHAVEVILPKYDCMRYDRIFGLNLVYKDLWVPFYGQWIPCDVYFGWVDGIKCFFIDPHSAQQFFNRRIFYGHADDGARFAFFSRAALEFMLKTNKHPEIIHCHDWQTALVPVLLYEIYQHLGLRHPRVCFTLHNVGHQGLSGDYILRQVGLNPASLMKSGIRTWAWACSGCSISINESSAASSTALITMCGTRRWTVTSPAGTRCIRCRTNTPISRPFASGSGCGTSSSQSSRLSD